MSTAQKIQELTRLISQTNDSKLINMVYALVKEYQQSDEVVLSEEQQNDLNTRIQARKKGKSSSLTWDEVQSKLKAI